LDLFLVLSGRLLEHQALFSHPDTKLDGDGFYTWRKTYCALARQFSAVIANGFHRHINYLCGLDKTNVIQTLRFVKA